MASKTTRQIESPTWRQRLGRKAFKRTIIIRRTEKNTKESSKWGIYGRCQSGFRLLFFIQGDFTTQSAWIKIYLHIRNFFYLCIAVNMYVHFTEKYSINSVVQVYRWMPCYAIIHLTDYAIIHLTDT